MPYLKIEQRFSGVAYTYEGPLEEGTIITGIISGKPAEVEVLENGDSLAINNVVCEGVNGAVMFDKRRFVRYGIVYLDREEVPKLVASSIQARDPLSRANTEMAGKLGGFYRRGWQQVGGEEPRQGLLRNVIEWTIGLL
jgi:hypothetical protein